MCVANRCLNITLFTVVLSGSSLFVQWVCVYVFVPPPPPTHTLYGPLFTVKKKQKAYLTWMIWTHSQQDACNRNTTGRCNFLLVGEVCYCKIYWVVTGSMVRLGFCSSRTQCVDEKSSNYILMFLFKWPGLIFSKRATTVEKKHTQKKNYNRSFLISVYLVSRCSFGKSFFLFCFVFMINIILFWLCLCKNSE